MSSDVNLSTSKGPQGYKQQPKESSDNKEKTCNSSISIADGRRRRNKPGCSSATSLDKLSHTSASSKKKTKEKESVSPCQDEKLDIKDPSVKYCPWSLTEPLEACDIQGNWYPAKIVEIKDFKVKIHFLRWKKRYDQWFDMDTNLIRSRIDPRGKDQHTNKTLAHNFEINEVVLARWTDTKLYPARIITILKGQYCQVLFYDGYKKKVKMNSLQKMPENYQGDQIPPQLLSSSTSNRPILTTTTSKTLSKPSLEPFDPFKHCAFICDTCNKGFRKESLLLQHKKHFHKIDLDIDDVPSLVPPQLRINKNSRQHANKETGGDSSNTINNSDISKLKIKFESDSNCESELVPISSSDQVSGGKKRKLESHPSIITINENKKSKHEDQQNTQTNTSSAISINESTTIISTLPSSTSTSTSTTTISPSSITPNVQPMKPLTVILPGRKSKPNNTLLFRDARQEAEKHENDNIEEFVKCICPLGEESGLMVQCELCLAWQHGSCAGFHNENDVPPHGYFCQFCRQPPKPVRSQQNSYQLNYWLKNAQHPQFTASMFEPLTTKALIPSSKNISEIDRFNNETMMINNDRSDELLSLSNATANGIRTLFRTSLFEVDANQSKQKKLYDENQAWNFYSSANDETGDSTRKSFTLHDLTTTSSQQISDSLMFGQSDVIVDVTNESNNDSLRNLVMSHRSKHAKSERYFVDPTDIENEDDEDEDELNQIRATNQLAAALYDCMINLHSLNYKIHNHRDIAYQQIIERQQIIQDNFELIQSKIEKIEKEIEQKDSFAIHTSSSTLSATSPENFGIANDVTLLSTQPLSSNPISYTPTKSSFSNNTNNLFGPSSVSEHSMIIENTNQQPTLSSLNIVDTSDHENSIIKTMDTNVDNNGSPVPTSSLSSNQPLARLLFTTGNTSVSNTDQEQIDILSNHQHNRPSMTHEYLPTNLTDGELKLELAYHYKDLQMAREVVLLSAN